jgi:hypothetical protein
MKAIETAGKNKNVFRIDLFGAALNVGGGGSDRPGSIFSRADVGDGSFATELGRPRHVRSEPLLTRVLDAPQAVVSRLRDGRRWMIVRPREK